MPIDFNYSGTVQTLDIGEVVGLQTSLDDKQEVITEINPILVVDVNGLELQLSTLQTNIDLKADQTDLNTEIQDRTNADTNLQTQINLKLAEANSIHRDNYAFYCVDGRNDLHSVLPNVNNQGAYISISSGSFGNLTPLTIDKDNMSMFSVPSTPPICEFACPLTIASTANRIRTRYMSFDGVCNLNGKRCVYSHSTFNEDVNIGQGTTEYMTIANCEFSAGKTITFSQFMGSVIYIIECNIAGANLVFNQSSPLQVIFSNCSGFVSLPTTSQATLVGLNVLASGAVVQHNISKIVLPTGEGTNNQVLTSTGSGNCIWTTPSGGGGGGGGVCLESIAVIPQAQSITTKSGQSLTFPNIVATTPLPAYPSFLNIGEFDYLPPTNTKMVILSYKIMLPYQGSFAQYLMFNCSQNATEITHTQVSFENGGGESPCYTIEVIINIDSAFGSDDIANGKLASWTTPKTFIFQGQKKISVYLGNIHGKYGYANQNLTFAPPTMKIEAFS